MGVPRAWAAFALGAAVAVGALAGLWAYSAAAPSTAVEVHLEILGSANGTYVYAPASVVVPDHARVTFTIVNHDPHLHATSWAYCNVSGTVDGGMEWGSGMGSGLMGGGRMHGLLPGQVSHTFTLRGNGMDLNIPIPPAATSSEPTTVVFTITTLGPGTVTWVCEADGMAGAEAPGAGMTGMFTTQG